MRLLWVVLACGCGGTAVIDDPPADDDDDMSAAGEDCPTLEWEPVYGSTWYEVLAVFTDRGQGGCAIAACHGDANTAANGIFLPLTDPNSTFNLAMYETLTGLRNVSGRRYVDREDPRRSWIQCHLEHHGDLGTAQQGYVKDWLITGAWHPEDF